MTTAPGACTCSLAPQALHRPHADDCPALPTPGRCPGSPSVVWVVQSLTGVKHPAEGTYWTRSAALAAAVEIAGRGAGRTISLDGSMLLTNARGLASNLLPTPLHGPPPGAEQAPVPETAMAWNSRTDIVEALESAGWISDDQPRPVLRHASGAAWALSTRAGDCGLDCPNDAVLEFGADIPDLVVIAACLAASGQLDPEREQHR